jgi:plasmid stabilization system protein ParE
MSYTLWIATRARADIRDTVVWLRQRNLARAARWYAQALAAIRTLASNPDRCPQAEEAADLGVDLRQLLFGKRRGVYRVLFIIDGQTVNILRVRHAAQDQLSPDDIS